MMNFQKPWLASYAAGVPHTIDPSQYANLSQFFTEKCSRFMDKIALEQFGHQLSYQEWQARSHQLAIALQQHLQLKPGDRVAIMLPNVLSYPIILFALWQAGLIVVNVNPLSTHDEIIHQLNDAEVRAIFVLDVMGKELLTARTQLIDLEHIVTVGMGDELGKIKRHLLHLYLRYIRGYQPITFSKSISYHALLATSKSMQFKPVQITADDIAVLQYTGGTTGIPKAAMLTHRNLIANILQAHAWVNRHLIEGEEIILTALPIYHIFALTANALLSLHIGAKNVLVVNPRDLSSLMTLLQRQAFTLITGVNTLFNAIEQHADFKKINYKKLKIALAGGMALQEIVSKRWQAVTGKPIIGAYGLTEASPAVCIEPIDIKQFDGSIGLALPSTEVSIRNDRGEEVALMVHGELWVRGPQVMKGYWNKPEESNHVLTADGWLKTGDIAYMNEEGYLFLVDRKKDLIIVSGFNVYPNEVEGVISQHPGVKDVAVIGIADEHSGEAVKAFIVKSDNDLTDIHLKAYLKEHLTAYKVPKFIEFCDELPKTNVGKVLRRALR